MIKEFALDPAVPGQSSKDCRYFLNALRIENGRVLASYPSNWKKKVYEAAENNHKGEVELSRIEVLLQAMSKKSLFASSRPYSDPKKSWLDNAINEHMRSPFAAVITTDAQGGSNFVLAADDVDTSPAFQATGQHEIARTSQEIIESVSLLIRVARTIKLIDPNFKARELRWRRGLRRVIELAQSGATIEIHRKDDGAKNVQSLFDGFLQRIIKPGLTVKVFTHPKAEMHNRFILTDQGGASFGTGLDDCEDSDGDVTSRDDVTLLTEAQREAKWAQYSSNREWVVMLRG